MSKWSSDLHSFFIFVDCNKLLSPGLVPLPVSSFPQHVSHGSGIFNIFESPRQFQCYSFFFQCLGFHLIFWTPPKGWHHFSISVSVALYAQVDPLHYGCCSWWSSHGTDISNTLGCSTPTRLHQSPLIGSLQGAKPQILYMTPSVLGHQLQLRLHLLQWPPWPLTVPSLSCSSWHLHAFKTSTTWVTLTHYQVQLQHEVQPWLSLEHSFFVRPENTSKISPQWCWSLHNHC